MLCQFVFFFIAHRRFKKNSPRILTTRLWIVNVQTDQLLVSAKRTEQSSNEHGVLKVLGIVTHIFWIMTPCQLIREEWMFFLSCLKVPLKCQLLFTNRTDVRYRYTRVFVILIGVPLCDIRALLRCTAPCNPPSPISWILTKLRTFDFWFYNFRFFT